MTDAGGGWEMLWSDGRVEIHEPASDDEIRHVMGSFRETDSPEWGGAEGALEKVRARFRRVLAVYSLGGLWAVLALADTELGFTMLMPAVRGGGGIAAARAVARALPEGMARVLATDPRTTGPVRIADEETLPFFRKFGWRRLPEDLVCGGGKRLALFAPPGEDEPCI